MYDANLIIYCILYYRTIYTVIFMQSSFSLMFFLNSLKYFNGISSQLRSNFFSDISSQVLLRQNCQKASRKRLCALEYLCNNFEFFLPSVFYFFREEINFSHTVPSRPNASASASAVGCACVWGHKFLAKF